MGTKYNHPQPKTVDERIKMVNILKEQFDWKLPIYIDNPSNEFNTRYKAWPDSAFVIDPTTRKIIYKSEFNFDSLYLTWPNEIIKVLNLI